MDQSTGIDIFQRQCAVDRFWQRMIVSDRPGLLRMSGDRRYR